MGVPIINFIPLPSVVIKHGECWEIPFFNGGFNGKIIYKWWIFQLAMFEYWKVKRMFPSKPSIFGIHMFESHWRPLSYSGNT